MKSVLEYNNIQNQKCKYFKPEYLYTYKYLGRMLGWGLKIWDNIKYKILEPKWRQVFSIRHYVGIYIYI